MRARQCPAGGQSRHMNQGDLVKMQRIFTLVLLPAIVSLCHENVRADHVDEIQKGVSQIGFPGSPGRLSVFGPRAFPIVMANASDSPGEQAAIVAGAQFGQGRMVAFAHDGYFGGTLQEADTGRLMLNLLDWASGEPDNGRPIQVGVRHYRQLAEFLIDEGIQVSEIQDSENLDRFDVVVVPTFNTPQSEIEQLADYVENGGGLISVNLGWAWLGYTARPGQTLADLPGNRLFADAGIVWCDGGTSTPPDRRLNVETPHPLSHANSAYVAFKAAADGRRRLEPEDVDRVLFTLRLALEQMPADDELLRPRLTQFASELGDDSPVPSARSPVRRQDLEARAYITIQTLVQRTLPVDEVRPHPAADTFPGSVAASADRVVQAVTIDTSVPDWHSTGLYAAPGEVITLRTDEQTATQGLSVRIGCHQDTLWHKATWERIPEITLSRPIESETTRVANPFGGLVYIVVPRDLEPATLSIEIDGCVRAPYFELGETDVADWRFLIRDAPAPWAELASDKLIITVPSEDIRNLDFPEQLMMWWDRVMDAQADLRTTPRERVRPERMVMDEQISAGYLHSGYPIMGQYHHGAEAVDLATLRASGNWGFYHELGHNHQRGEWTYAGTGEVTVNLFSLYCLDMINPGADYHPAITAQAVERHIEQFQQARQKGDAFRDLVPYVQMQREFGWDTYKAVFAEYEELPRSERPRNDQQKRDQWLVRFSRHAGRNLGPFFEFWKIDTTEEARASINDLPVWMPEELQ